MNTPTLRQSGLVQGQGLTQDTAPPSSVASCREGVCGAQEPGSGICSSSSQAPAPILGRRNSSTSTESVSTASSTSPASTAAIGPADSVAEALDKALTTYIATDASDPALENPANLLELRSRHREVIRLAFTGMTHREISERMNLAPVTVTNILRSPLAQAQLEKLQAQADKHAIEVRARIQNLAHSAVDVMEALLEERDARIRLSAAEGLLDRGGYGKTQRIESVSISALVSPEDLAEINRRMALVRQSGLVLDVSHSATQEEPTHDRHND